MRAIWDFLGCFLIVLAMMMPTSASADSAAVPSGLAWLSAQVQSDGTLAMESAAIATPLQSRSEVLTTLGELDSVPSALAAAVTADSSDSTEALARRIIAAQASGTDASTLIAILLDRQNDDGGFGPESGFASATLDTAFALLACRAASVTTPVPAALGYLQGIQASNGAFSDGDLHPTLYITAYAILAMKAYADSYGLGTSLTAAVNYLQSQRASGALWGDSVFLTALDYMAVHDFVPQSPTGTDIQSILGTAQAQDGSWNDDPYVTALALRALALTSKAPQNPGLGQIKGQVIDGQTGMALDGATVSLSGPTSGTATTTNGAFSFGNLNPGSYSLTISFADYGTVTATTLIASGQTVNLGSITLGKSATATTGTIRGTVTDAATGSGIAGAVVTAGLTSAVTDANGNYQASNVTPGTIIVQVAATGYASASGTADLTAGGILVFSPALSDSRSSGGSTGGSGGSTGGNSIHGTITDAATGAALAGVTVAISGAASASATTDSSGQYSISGLGSGQITATASLSGYDSVVASTILAASSQVDFSPKMYTAGTSPANANTASVTGVVVDAGSNAPLANATIQASYNGISQTLQAGADGRFTVKGITSATINLAVHQSGYVDESTSIPLQPLTNEDVGQIRLRQTSASILQPDLTITSADHGTAITDPQTLMVNGSVDLTISNKGAANAPSGITVLAFSDTNLNGAYDPGVDQTLGQATTAVAITPNGKLDLKVLVSGKLPFRDAPISLFVDSNQAVAELKEDNNVASTAMGAQVSANTGTGSIDPVLKWQWTGGNVITAPIVGPLMDTNGDGKVDQNDIPAIVFVSYGGFPDGACGPVTALSGKDGHMLWQATDPSLCADAPATPAIGDIDGDGKPEVVAYLHSGGMVALNGADGSVKWRSNYPPSPGKYDYGAPTIADIDGDGKAEILARNYVINSDGSLRWVGAYPAANTNVAKAVDLDGDGKPEILVGNTAYHNDGSVYWHNTNVYNGFYLSAIGRFDGSDQPEIVMVSSYRVWLLGHDGHIIWGPVYLAAGGAPTIADMDGDGKADIGVSGYTYYTVLNGDGSIKWQTRAPDAMTGASAFDFNGDGKAEICYSDTDHFYIFDGSSGAPIFSIANGSATAKEYPVVADVDNDHHADVIVPQNYFGGRGLRVFQGKNNTWSDTRRIWNEYAYHITNVNDDGSIPRVEKNSWQDTNTYRLNALTSTTMAPDLTASYLRVQDFGGNQPSPMTVRIGNGGGVQVPAGILVAFYNGDPANGGQLLGTVKTTQALDSGQFEDVTFNESNSLSGISDLYVVADDDGTGQHAISNDFDRSNNTVSLPLSSLPGAFTLTVSTDKSSYGPNTDVQITANVSNHGSFDSNAQVQFSIETADGTETVATLPPPAAASVLQGASQPVNAVWNTGGIFVGSYQVKAELVDDQGKPYASATTPFTLISGQATSIGGSISTDKVSYASNDTVAIQDRVINSTANTLTDSLTVQTSLLNPDGSVRWSNSAVLPPLSPSELRELNFSVPIADAPAGKYKAVLNVLANGTAVVASTTGFTVESSAVTGTGITGHLQLSPTQVPLGEPVTLNVRVANQGNATLTKLPVSVRIIDPDGKQVLYQQSTTIDTLSVGGVSASIYNWQTSGTVGKTYVVVVSTTINGKALILAKNSFLQLPPPIKLNVTQSMSGANRVLVLLTCHPGWQAKGACKQKHNVDCVQQREATLEALLTALKVPHRITTNVPDFVRAMRSGVYNGYWILGGVDKWRDQLSEELQEAVFRGDGLLMDSSLHGWHNHPLYAVAGVKYAGRLWLSDQHVSINGTKLPAGIADTQGQPLRLRLTTGVEQASFDGMRCQRIACSKGDDRDRHETASCQSIEYPAIVSNDYGEGHALVLGFDLVDTLKTTSTLDDWHNLVQAMLAYLQPTTMADSVPPYGYIPLLTHVKNEGIVTELQADMSLPGDSLYLDSSPTAKVNSGGALSWTLPLAKDAEIGFIAGFAAPSTAGSYTVKTTVNTINGGASTPYGEYPFYFTVRDTRDNETQLLNTLTTLSLKPRESALRNRAVRDIRIGIQFAQHARYGRALDELSEAAEDMAKISDADVSDARLILDQVMQGYELQWHYHHEALVWH